MRDNWQLETYLTKVLKLSQEFSMIVSVSEKTGKLVIKDFNRSLASELLLAENCTEVDN